jgi:hypothetical protein
MKLTPWFPGEVVPAYPGVYERRYRLQTAYARWDGSMWWWAATNVDEAGREENAVSVSARLPWRGLAEPPEAA